MNRLCPPAFLPPAALILLTTSALASPALAATTVDSASTTALQTSAAGDISLSGTGTITVASGSAVRVDSANAVTIASGGGLVVGNADGASGITIDNGTTSTITNAGSIRVAEDFTAADADSNGIADGAIAQASNRYGIHLAAGSAAGGSITNSGAIVVEGLNSAGIALDAPYTGTLTNSGTITVKGDGSAGIRTGTVNGDVVAGGVINAIGAGTQGVVLTGDVSGMVKLSGTITQATSYTTDAATTQSLSRRALATGAAAVSVGGNVAGGILVYAPSTTGTSETTGTITAYGTSPALLIGSASNITIGSVAGHDGSFALAIDGTASASSAYSSTDAYGVVIGGQGGTVNMAGGIGVSGTISASTVDSAATALLINQGATVPSLYVSGAIKATISSPGLGSSYAVRDLSGSLTRIDNTGFISVSGSSEDKLAAIDLSANTSGVTIAQYLNATDKAAQVTEQAASTYTAATAATYTLITGDILTGTGNDTLDVASGRITGNSWLGGGNDRVLLSGDSKYVGDIHFGTGSPAMALSGTASFTGALDVAGMASTLTIGDSAAFSGTVTGGSQLAVTVNGGSFGVSKVATFDVGSLDIGSTGTLTAYIDGATGTSSLIRAGSASFASGAKVAARITSLASAAGSYTILSANALTGTASFDNATTSLPVLFKGSVTTSGNDLMLNLSRKSASELGLTSAQGQAYDAIYDNAVANTSLGTSLLQTADITALQTQMDALMPDHAGGVFDFARRGSRLVTRHLTDDSSLFDISNVGAWLEPVLFHGSKYASGTSAFATSGWGLSTGFERATGVGNLGLSFAWITGNVDNGSWQTIKANNYSLGAFWRKSSGPLYAFARIGADHVSLSSTRTFTGAVDSAALTYAATGSWSGWAMSGTAGASYKAELPGNFTLKPMVVVDYYRLHEKAYQESGSTVIDLAVDGRTSSATTATTSLTAGWSMGRSSREFRPFTIEVEGGRHNRLAGQLGTTTAAFADGSQFAITPDALKSGWMAEARILSGGFDYTWKLAAGAEQTQGKVDYSARASLSVAF